MGNQIRGKTTLSVQQHFDQKAGNYYQHVYLSGKKNCHVHNQQVRRAWFRRWALEQTNQGRALDVGCGPGSIAKELSDLGFETYCIDLSLQMLLNSRRNTPTAARVVQCSADALCFQDNSFDLVTAAGVLEYVRCDDRALREMYRVIKPGGSLIVSVPIKGLVSVRTKQRWGRRRVDDFHHKGYRPRRFLSAVNDAGFVVTRRVSHHFTFFPFDYFCPRLSIQLDHLLSSYFGNHSRFAAFGKTMIVQAVKPAGVPVSGLTPESPPTYPDRDTDKQQSELHVRA